MEAALAANREQQCCFRRRLEGLQVLSLRLAVAISVASEASIPVVREEWRRSQINAPQRRPDGGDRTRPLRGAWRRELGAPYFVDFDGSTPDEESGTQSPRGVGSARSSNALGGKIRCALKWDDKLDHLLAAAVVRVHRAAAVQKVFDMAEIAAPHWLPPLGSVSLHTLANPGPRAALQFEDTVRVDSLEPFLASLPASVRAECVKQLRCAVAVRTMSDMPLELDEPFDWVRVCHGGFLPADCTATPLDCKVRWYSQLACPQHTSTWTPEEDDALQVCVSTNGTGNWDKIAKLVSPRRHTAGECFRRARQRMHSRGKAEWTAAEDAELLTHVREHGETDWGLIALLMPGRSRFDVLRRWQNSVDPDVKKGAFTVEEEVRVRLLLKLHGGDVWEEIQAFTPGRSAAALREHYINAMRHTANFSRFSPSEDATILELASRGHKWTFIAKELGTQRSDNQVYGRWKRITADAAGKAGGRSK